jgi:hypothetical protein
MAPSYKVAVIQWHIKVSRASIILSYNNNRDTTLLISFLFFRFPAQNLAPEENHTKACNYIRQAAAQGAVLAVLPE